MTLSIGFELTQCACAHRLISDPFYELTQTSPLAISPQLFRDKLKTLLWANPILIHRLLHTSLPVSTPSTIHHSRLTVCLPDSLDLTEPLKGHVGEIFYVV